MFLKLITTLLCYSYLGYIIGIRQARLEYQIPFQTQPGRHRLVLVAVQYFSGKEQLQLLACVNTHHYQCAIYEGQDLSQSNPLCVVFVQKLCCFQMHSLFCKSDFATMCLKSSHQSIKFHFKCHLVGTYCCV